MSMPWKYSALAILALLLISYNVWCYMLLSVTMPLSKKMISDIKFCNMSTKNVSNTDITIETNSVEWKVIQNENEDVLNGGRYRPLNCTTEDRVAIIVPYRDREYHLKIFLRHMHPFLKRQQIDYGIFVIEMQARIPFNRGMLMNVGYAEARKEYNYQCFIFHDVDLLPLQDRNKYVCTKYPKHMAVAIDTRNYRLRYKTGFGGVNAFTKDQFEKINGFANIYFGWGREDDDLFQRTMNAGLKYNRLSHPVGRYKDLAHTKQSKRNDNNSLYRIANRRFKTDGINSMNYTVVKKELRPLFTWVLVHLAKQQMVDEKRTS